MLIEVKEPSAVIPLTEYERLKKIEDRYQDDIESYRQRSKHTLLGIIDKLISADGSQLVVVTTDKMVGRYVTIVDESQLTKFINKRKITLNNEDKEKMKLALYQELDKF